jgi:exopolyphosphatase/guanosine-5'-triphosphate,3'-diphosphate pyrophosphatase
MVRLAAGLDETGSITEEAFARAQECLTRFGQRLKHIDASHIQAVGTNTLRIAGNSDQFLEMAEQSLGHSIGVISGYEEARLIYSGVAHSISESENNRLVMDIGGGSTELIVGNKLDPIYMESLPVGCVSMSARFFSKEVISEKQFKKCETAVMVEIEPYIKRYRELGWDEAVGSSGTIRSVSRVLAENGWTDGLITLTGLEKIKSALLEINLSEGIKLQGLSEKRAPVFPGGVAILLAVFKSLGIKSMKVSDGAIREGLLYELIGRQKDQDIREKSVAQLIQRFNIDQQHQQNVKNTCINLLRQAADSWGLDEYDEDLLVWAAALHETGLIVSHQQYHKHGAYILENLDLAGFSRQEQQRLALLVRNHRGGLSRTAFKALSKNWSKKLQQLAILLRLAVILHRSRTPESLPELVLTVNENVINLKFSSDWLASHPLTTADLQSEAEMLLEREWVLEYS